MGNRAVVIFKHEKTLSPAVYLHWNGGLESILAFLQEMDRRKIRGGSNMDYQVARFIHVCCDFFDLAGATGLSVGTFNAPKSLTPASLKAICPGDNGVFVIERSGTCKITQYVDGKMFINPISRLSAADKEVTEGIAKAMAEARPIVKDF
mgnify:CR=1 FL=1